MTIDVLLDDKLRMSKETTRHKMFRQLALGGGWSAEEENIKRFSSYSCIAVICKITGKMTFGRKYPRRY